MMNPMGMHMQQPGVGPGGPVGMPGGPGGPVGVGVSPVMMQSPQMQQQQVQQQQQHQAQQQQQQQQQAQQPEKVDNIAKVKALVGPLRDALSTTIKTSAQLLQQNNLNDAGTKGGDLNAPTPKFDKHLEEFYSICDQIELNLKTAKLCMQQGASSQQYLPIPVAPTQPNPAETNALSYSQYLDVVKIQIGYAKDIHDTLICAAQNISPSE
ncbi:intersex [Culex quinquefasciatus]|uniref:Mediator of RNA polymerase II transcription subunit 29 n=1 Tax=Culex quinquefasciatus TaxID=7176 RepID=B0WLM3_CULQU|nr:mediator of RNA polymerase II transcription subunit 29 [Culex quinquefasciatus]EDS30565.1 intersex [Culex quinquefasciatus]|eukprot:XP_001849607.1 intersex [Culex quinquefasciatus]